MLNVTTLPTFHWYAGSVQGYTEVGIILVAKVSHPEVGTSQVDTATNTQWLVNSKICKVGQTTAVVNDVLKD
jgi:hypothetical protein